ncbi:DUF2760 domain-containing protein [Deltaproteobacteria bacterium TL4]
MEEKKSLNWFYRVFIFTLLCFWKIMFDRKFGDRVYALRLEVNEKQQKKRAAAKEAQRLKKEGKSLEARPEEQKAKTVSTEAKTVENREALRTNYAKETPVKKKPESPQVDGIYLLSLFQRSGRLVDFLQQDVTAFSDSDVAGAARVIHEGCRQVLTEYFSIEPIRAEEEGSPVTVNAGFDSSQIQLSGNVQGEPPYHGELLHHGWKVTKCNLPQLTNEQARSILAPAEIEV